MSDTAVRALLSESTTVPLTPGYEGANIGTVIGFKHIYYMIEKAVIEHFRHSGLPIGELYERYGVGFDVVEQSVRLPSGLKVDDEVVADVRPATGADDRLRFAVTVTVERDGKPRTAATAKIGAVLRYDDNAVRVTRREPVPAPLDRFVVRRIGAAGPDAAAVPLPARQDPAWRLVSGGSTERDPVLDRLLAGRNAYGWKLRIPYPYVHFFERLQMSGYVRLMEEAKHRFVDARGISIATLLAEHNWIPAVTRSELTILDEALLEQDLYVVYEVEQIFKNLLYTSRVDYHVARDGRLVHAATGSITHGYGWVRNGCEGGLVTWDDRVARSLRGQVAAR